MAPRGSKRAVAADVASPKKQRGNPKLEGILATLQSAEHLNEPCREMLIAMTLGLDTAKGERHASQTLGVAMIEETLQGAKAKFAGDVTLSLDELSSIEASNTTLMTRMTDADASLEEKQSAKKAAHSCLDAAKQAVVSAEGTVAEAKKLQCESDASVAALGKERTSLEAAFQDHLKTPMDNDKVLHHHSLAPFVNKLDLEESLKLALPSSCVKTKEHRGNFDDLVISSLIKAWNKRIAALTQSIEEAAPAVSDRKAATLAAEALLEGNMGVQQTNAAELEAARASEAEAEGEVRKTKEEFAVLGPKLKKAVDKHASLKATLDDFVDGTLATFEGLRDQEPVGEVAAPAGA